MPRRPPTPRPFASPQRVMGTPSARVPAAVHPWAHHRVVSPVWLLEKVTLRPQLGWYHPCTRRPESKNHAAGLELYAPLDSKSAVSPQSPVEEKPSADAKSIVAHDSDVVRKVNRAASWVHAHTTLLEPDCIRASPVSS
ncbi:MAG: hypothetical protein CL927_15095 [Deltaproteobacteria bacterium]|nr:hypothetical protein [Deltaproteobacteria bacterium]HCH66694.1 hypothetical protein [Deltaproteobacteria bacterium]